MAYSKEKTKRLYELHKQITSQGIRYVNKINSIPRLEAILADPYEQRMITFRRRRGIEPFDFRGKGITPKPGAWVHWKPLSRYDRQRVRGHGRFVEMLDGWRCVVRYDLWLGTGYTSRKIEIDVMQIVDYSEEK